MADFDRKLTESDAYLQLLIEQSIQLEQQCQITEEPTNKARCQIISGNLHQVLESIKHCIVLLQIAKNTAFPVNGVYHPCNSIPDPSQNKINNDSMDRQRVSDSGTDDLFSITSMPSTVQIGIEVGSECAESHSVASSGENRSLSRQERPGMGNCRRLPSASVPDVSYSSSEDEDFFDADDFAGVSCQNVSVPKPYEDAVETFSNDCQKGTSDHLSCEPRPSSRPAFVSLSRDAESNEAIENLSDPSLDFDSMYDEEDEELGSLEGHGSVIQHLISQVKIGMDLTKVVLPTFILERRSLLEMYADFFAHPDLFCSIADFTDPRDRMVQVLKWYLSAFHAGRKSEVARKPYNPILGEHFRCYWDVPQKNKTKTEEKSVPVASDGPVPWAASNQLGFIAEQVSHHPPISAFYAEHKEKKISFCGHIWTKSKFLGLSVCVNNIGQGCVSLLDLDEEYILNFPSGYGRSILTVPWVELGGTCQITCSKTGYSANVEFLTKPFYGGKKHRICAEVVSPGEKKPFLVVEGEWNGVMNAKWSDGRTEVFVDTLNLPIERKKVKPVMVQDSNESRFLWREVTAGLKFNNIDKATGAKFALEQKQREEAKQRKESASSWQTKIFSLEGENWVYNLPLQKRLK